MGLCQAPDRLQISSSSHHHHQQPLEQLLTWLQVWKEITARIRAAMVKLEAAAPPNWIQEEPARTLPPKAPSVVVQQTAVDTPTTSPL